jgi:hypothetical protein
MSGHNAEHQTFHLFHVNGDDFSCSGLPMTRRDAWFFPVPVLLAATLFACGGDGGPSGPVSGSLAVAVSGLPGGAPASIAVSGPGGFAQSLTGTQTLSSLAPGSYTVTSSGVSFGGLSYTASPATQSVTVSQGDTPASASVDYAPSAPALTVSVSGLPSGTSANVTVTGPGGFSQPVAATQTLTGLAPGDYTITASDVANCSFQYAANPATQTTTVAAGVTASASVSYSAASGGALNLCIDGMYLTQSVQTYDGSVPLVKGRDGYLRVFVTANQVNTAAPSVRVTFYNGGSPVQTMTISAPGLSTPLSANEASLSSSWNVPVPKALIQPGLSMLAEVDPDNTVAESSEGDNTFPASGTPLSLDVHTSPTFSVRLVPVTVAGRSAGVTSGNLAQFLTDAMKMHPLATIDADLRATYVSSAPALDASNQSTWTQVLSEVAALQDGDNSTRYYYGVVNPNYSSGIAGVGFVGAPVALGWDKLPSGSGVAAHEWGHNWGRQHSPCGGAANPDPNYPYANGVTGVYGLDVATVTLKPPTSTDVMAYCNNVWISDYTYEGVLSFREANPDITTALTQAMQPCLLVWGRIENGQPILEPAFEVVTRPHLPARAGDYVVEGRAADGSPLFSLPFAPTPVADVSGDARVFSFAIPMTSDRVSRLSSLRLAGRGREVVSTRTALVPRPGTGTMPVTMRRTTDGRIAMQWDPASHPMLLVRDGDTGQIISFARGGSVELPGGHSRLSVAFSNRVQSGELRVAVPPR